MIRRESAAFDGVVKIRVVVIFALNECSERQMEGEGLHMRRCLMSVK